MRGAALLAGGLACVAVSGIAAYYAKPPRQVPPGLWPDRQVVDFGQQPQNTVVEARVPFRNHLPAAVDIVETSRTCTCSSVSVTKTRVEPGETTELVVTWKLGSRRGVVAETMTLLYLAAGGTHETTSVQLRADVLPDIAYEPRAVVFEPGKPGRATVRFSPGRLAAFRLQGAAVNQAAFSAAVDAERNEVEIGFDPAVAGHTGPGVTLYVMCDSPNEPRMEIPVRVKSPPGDR